MYAVVEAGGKQYKVAKNDVVLVEIPRAKEGSAVKLTRVLFAKDGAVAHVGNPYIKGAHVACEVLGNVRGDKVIAYKYRKRKSSKKKIGHRSELVELKIKEIEIAKG